MRRVAATVLLSTLTALPAFAQDTEDRAFTGPSVTVIGGAETARWFSRSDAAVLYGIQLGHDWQANGLVFGIEGEAARAAKRHCFTIRAPGGGEDRYCMKPEQDFYAGGRLGTVMGDSTLLYAKAGYSNARRLYDLQSFGTGTANYSSSATTDGFALGTGVETRVGASLTFKAEYRYSNYGSNYSRHQAAVGLGFRF